MKRTRGLFLHIISHWIPNGQTTVEYFAHAKPCSSTSRGNIITTKQPIMRDGEPIFDWRPVTMIDNAINPEIEDELSAQLEERSVNVDDNDI